MSGGSRWNDIAFLPIVADTEGRLHDDAARLLYQVASIKVSGWGPHPGRINRRSTIFRRLQADLGLLVAALGAQQRHDTAHFLAVAGREWSPKPHVNFRDSVQLEYQ